MVLIHNNPPDRYFGKVSQTSAARAISSLGYAGLRGWLKCCAHADGFQWKSPTLEPEEIKELASKGFLQRGDGISCEWHFDSMGGSPSEKRESVCKVEHTEMANRERKETMREPEREWKENRGMRFRNDKQAGLMAEYEGEWLQVFERDGDAWALDWQHGRDIPTGYRFAEAESLAMGNTDLHGDGNEPCEAEYEESEVPF